MYLFSRHKLKQLVKIITQIAILVILLTFIAYAPFGYNLHLFSGLKLQLQLFEVSLLSLFPFWLTILGAYFGGIDFFKRGFLIFALYLSIASFWFMAWYLIWLIPLAIINGVWMTIIVFIWSLFSFPYPFSNFMPMQIFTPIGFLGAYLVKRNIENQKFLQKLKNENRNSKN
jgi:hypothetical protein